MKIRIKDNSVRIRLTRSEVSELSERKQILAKTEFINGDFGYGIECVDQGELSASFEVGQIIIQMPTTYVQEWIETDRVTFEGQFGKLHLLLEKDFVCIDRPEEDQSDNYPNPNIIC